MSVLLVHPDDSPVEGAWAREAWDFVIDLGWAGESAYREWEHSLRCPVRGLYAFAQGPEDFRQISETLRPCLGKLVDRQGLDWWEILAPLRYLDLLHVELIKRARSEVGPADLVGTRPCVPAWLFAQVAGVKIQFPWQNNYSMVGTRWGRLRIAAQRLTGPQLLQVALDKFDSQYQLRRIVTRRSKAGTGMTVLMPSGYGNVTRVMNAYAKLLPSRDFLLVATRQSGILAELADNVRVARLAGFADATMSASTERELRELEHAWSGMQAGVLKANAALAMANSNGWFRDIGNSLGRWLRVRDAWRQVFAQGGISAVFCGDENNATNRIPVLLARRQGLRTVHCDHGALDVLLALRSPACDMYLAKGQMEKDFLTRACAMEPGRITEGAPAQAALTRQSHGHATEEAIIFFSEQYELTQGRTRVLYQEVLPPLCELAHNRGARLIVKLHPFESAALRRELLDGVLTGPQRAMVDLVHGPLTEEMMAKAWFALTVESSVAVDCAIRGIPCFLCRWFVTPMTGYEKQFARYGAGLALNSPAEIPLIPEMLKGKEITSEVQRGLWNPIAPARLDALLSETALSENLMRKR